MKKYSNRSWIFPCCLFIFLSIFISVKFIFIFFFRAAYEPKFIFELTPLFLLSGLNNVQLSCLSLLTILSDTYLHVQTSKRCLLLSFLPTSLMLSSLGFTIMFSEMNLSYIYHYVLFGCLLLVVLIDYKHVLVSIETPTIMSKKELKPIKITDKEPAAVRAKSFFAKDAKFNQTPQVPIVTVSTSELKEVSDTILSKMQAMLEDLERKTLRIEKLENNIEERRRNLVDQEKMLTYDVTSYLKLMERMENKSKDITTEVPSVDKIFIEGKVVDRLVIEKTTECAAIIQKGVLKEINHSFANFLGYEINEIINKNLFVFFTPEGLEAVKKYCLSRLRGVASNSYKTVFVTKNYGEIPVEITVKPTIYKGEAGEFLVIKEIKNK